MTHPEEPVKLAPRASSASGRSQAPPSARTKSLLEGSFLGTMAGLATADAEVSDVSDADPQAMLQTMKDIDDMDADLLGLKKSSLTSNKPAAKASGKEEPLGPLQPAAGEKGDAAPLRKPPPAPSSGSSGFGIQHRKFSFADVEDPLAGLLSDEEEEGTAAKQLRRPECTAAPDRSPSPIRDRGPSVPLTPGDTPVRKKDELMFDEGDDIMASLGFGDNPIAERGQAGDQEGPRPARSKLDELLGRGSAARLMTCQGTGGRRDFQLDRKYRRPEDKADSWGDEDLTFGAYQPTVGSSEGRPSRRQSVSRFLAESGTDPKGALGSRQSTPAISSPVQPKKGGADWLGLKDDDDLDLLPSSPTREAPRGGSALVPLLPASRRSAPTGLPGPGPQPPSQGASSPPKASHAAKLGPAEEKEEDDWLSHALSRKKSRSLAREEQAGAPPGRTSADATDHARLSSRPAADAPGPEQTAPGGTSGRTAQVGRPGPGEPGSPVACTQAAPATLLGSLKRGLGPGVSSDPEPALRFPTPQEGPVQPLLAEPLPCGQLPGAQYQLQLQGGAAELQAELLQSQARLAELEAQVRKLELERNQHTLLLQSLQQRHQADLELIESAHRSRVKVLEASFEQREERLRRENEELSARYLAHCQEAEQARAELAAQHQRRLAAAAQEKDQEMERLRELQRASVLEMHRDHAEQLQRLKVLKDREIDAVTSATSHTRSLSGVIEQMETFSSSLGELAARVEASHLSTSQECERGARQRDAQLRVLQERLGQQQRDMEEERSRLQEVIAKMEARLGEQSRLLEQERWRVSAEQSKAESAQRALEEQRKVAVRQAALEREELERAKSALLEEQKAVMHRCAEERRRLSSEWAELSAQQRLGKERAERDAERALQADTQREGTLVSLAKEQAELKIRASELRAKEEQLATEREALERGRQELRLERERVSAAALRVRLRSEEVESMSKVASEKYEAGERALSEARQVQAEHQVRLQRVQQQQERLRQQEQHVHQEQLSLAQQRLQLDLVRQDLPSSLAGLLPRLQVAAAPSPSAASPAAATAGPGCSQPPPAASLISHLHAKLVLLKHTAEQDRDFLENEQFFLETLKKAPYNMTSYSA